jgi:hypothetical protein
MVLLFTLNKYTRVVLVMSYFIKIEDNGMLTVNGQFFLQRNSAKKELSEYIKVMELISNNIISVKE